MRAELSKLHNRLQTTIIYVTHDQTEAMTYGRTVIVVMKDGHIYQVGAPFDIYNHPNNVFVAGFIGSPAMNFLDVVLKKEGEVCSIDAQTFKMDIPAEKLRFHQEHWQLCQQTSHSLAFAQKTFEDASIVGDDPRFSLMEAAVDVTEPMGAQKLMPTSPPARTPLLLA